MIVIDVWAKEIGAMIRIIPIPHKPSFEAWLDDWIEEKARWNEVWGKRGG